MKRSEFEAKEREMYMSSSIIFHSESIDAMVARNVAVAERAGVTWEPEESEVAVIWEGSEKDDEEATVHQILSDGRYRTSRNEGDFWYWPLENEHPALQELARRLLAEKDAILNLDCDGPIIPGELTDHPAFKAVWEVIEGWDDPVTTGAHILKILRALRDAGVVIPAKKEHVTDGSPCWCNPATEKPDIAPLPDGDRLPVAETAPRSNKEQEVDSWLAYYGITPGCPAQLLSRGALRGMALRLLGAK